MSFNFECTACGTRLKTATQPPAGKKVPCPKCNATIVIPAHSLDDPSSNPPPPLQTSPTGNRRGDSRDEDEENDRLSFRLRPRNQAERTKNMTDRSTEDDEEEDRLSFRLNRRQTPMTVNMSEKPRSEDEDPPASFPQRSKRKEDDELSRRARDDFDDRGDDDDFDRPRRRRRQPKGNKVLPFLVLGIGALIIAGVLAAFLLFGGSTKADAEMLAFVPEGTNAMGGIDVEDVLNQDRIKRVVDMALNNPDGQKVNQFLQGFGLKKEDLSKVMVAVNLPANIAVQEPNPDQMDITFIVKLKSGTFDGNKIKQTLRATEVQKDGKTYYKTAEGSCYIPSEKIAVFCKQESTIAKLIAKNGKDAELSPDLKSLVDKHGGDQIWVSLADAKLLSSLMNQPGILGGMPLGGGMGGAAELKNAKGLAFSGGLKGDDLKMAFSLSCQNSSTSAKLVTDSRQQMKQVREALKAFGGMGGPKGNQMDIVTDILDSVDFDSDGDLFSTSMKMDIAKLEKLAGGGMGNPFAGMNPFGGGGFQNPFGGLLGGGGNRPPKK
jgi:hypothetical protein